MSFQVFLPFGPPAVLRLEVAEAANGTDIKYTNHLNIHTTQTEDAHGFR